MQVHTNSDNTKMSIESDFQAKLHIYADKTRLLISANVPTPQSPVLPNNIRQHSPHKIPMPSSTSHGRLLHLTTNLASPEYLSLLPARFEIVCGYFVLRLEILSPCRAAQKVCFERISKRECFQGFSAEHDHVGVVRRLEGFGLW